MSDLRNDNYVRFATSGKHFDYAWGVRATKPFVYSLQGKKIKLKDGTSYLGSYWINGYSVDMMLNKDGIPYIMRNLYENWANSQQYSSTIDLSLPVDRFEISNGEEGNFKEYNDKVRAEKLAKREFYREVIEEAKEQFGLSNKQVKILLKFAGTVSALSVATDFERNGLSTDQALRMLRKTSHAGMERVLSEKGIRYPGYTFDVIQRAAETLAYIHTLQEGNKQYTSSKISTVLDNLRESEIREFMKSTEKIAIQELEDKTHIDD